MKLFSHESSDVPEVLLWCPLTGLQVTGRDRQQIEVPGGYAIWWRCASCRGWHILLMDQTRKEEQLSEQEESARN